MAVMTRACVDRPRAAQQDRRLMAFTVLINGQPRVLDCEPDMPLLWGLRDLLGLTGTKYSCGKGLCGACTVHLDGAAVRSCSVPVSEVKGAITTIEGIAGPVAERVLAAWDAHQVAQCGYCQPGQVMAAIALIAAGPVDDAALEATMNGNLCRCATYMRIRAAVRDAAQTFAQTVSA
ncbi:(2Fe-2S)-binding protein [Novosphingobium resinovorum]|uniref:(2Fe-2S)-binding protein n=2 Tax=Novosphingobium TaxID=165696 RepID=UPI0028529E4F|nr:2Fe-2S iron-sulfur cluster-binding protein [Novosphingobium resinovorum]